MKRYENPTLTVNRLLAVRILTVSTEGEWGGDGESESWDDALEEVNGTSDDA